MGSFLGSYFPPYNFNDKWPFFYNLLLQAHKHLRIRGRDLEQPPGWLLPCPPSEFPGPLPGRRLAPLSPTPERTALFLACLFDTVLLNYLSRKPGVCFCFVHGWVSSAWKGIWQELCAQPVFR